MLRTPSESLQCSPVHGSWEIPLRRLDLSGLPQRILSMVYSLGETRVYALFSTRPGEESQTLAI